MLGTFCVICLVINYTLSNYTINEDLLVRYTSIAEYAKTTRFEIMRQGLGLLGIKEFLIGSGLSSVVVSGPHNDFIRWTQRIGIPAMILSFIPFIISLSYVMRFMRRKKNSPMLLFILSALLFTLYHSLFGYPREDAYQSVYAFLGLGLWLAISKKSAQPENFS